LCKGDGILPGSILDAAMDFASLILSSAIAC
jgi:hypothetical protein